MAPPGDVLRGPAFRSADRLTALRTGHGRGGFTASSPAGTIARMIGGVAAAGLEIIGAWLECAVGLVRRWSAPLMEPIVRLVGAPLLGPLPDPPREARDPAAPQVEVEEAKYWLGPGPESDAGYVDRETGELPRAYGRDRIVLLPRDPWWTFAYWEVTPSTRVRALRALGSEAEGAREVLRVYDVTFIAFTGDNAWLSFDLEVPPGADHWYLNVGRPAASFCAEIGLRTPAGRFLPLARSNTVTTPRASPSPDTSVRWMDLRRPGAPADTPAWTGVLLPTEDRSGAAADRPRSSDVHAPRVR